MDRPTDGWTDGHTLLKRCDGASKNWANSKQVRKKWSEKRAMNLEKKLIKKSITRQEKTKVRNVGKCEQKPVQASEEPRKRLNEKLSEVSSKKRANKRSAQ